MAGTLPHHLPHAEHLIDDLVHGQGALQAALARGTKAAGHRATHLAAHAHREPIASRNPHRFQGESIGRFQQQLGGAIAGHTAVQLLGAANPIARSDRRRLLQLLAPGLRQHRDRIQAAGAFGIEPIVQLTTAKGGLALGLGPLLQSRTSHPQQGTGRLG